jgi:hypothetical protein
LLAPVNDASWKIIDKKKWADHSKGEEHDKASLSKTSTGNISSARQKEKLITPDFVVSKRPRLHNDSVCPLGLEWDSNSWSCAYDSLFVILYDIWSARQHTWTRRFKAVQNEYLTALVDGFDLVSKGEKSFENVRDSIRTKLNVFDAQRFPTGRTGTSVAMLAIDMFKTRHVIASTQLVCPDCEFYDDAEVYSRRGYVLQPHIDQSGSTKDWILTLHDKTSRVCPDCSSKLEKPILYYKAPDILFLEYSHQDIEISHVISVRDHKNNLTNLHLKGVVYLGGYHFTSRIVSETGDIWYHDGKTTKRSTSDNGHIKIIHDSELRECNGNDMVLVVYAQK